MRNEKDIAKAIALLDWYVDPNHHDTTGLGKASAEVEQYLLGLESMRQALVWSVDDLATSRAADQFQSSLDKLRDTLIEVGVLPNPGDTKFTDSPDIGDTTCICSRCGLIIGNWQERDKNSKGGVWRACLRCLRDRSRTERQHAQLESGKFIASSQHKRLVVTHCFRDHEYTIENTALYIRKRDGKVLRACKQCQQERNAVRGDRDDINYSETMRHSAGGGLIS